MVANRKQCLILALIGALALLGCYSEVCAEPVGFGAEIYNPGHLKPTDSNVTLKVGDQAPDFVLPSISGNKITLREYPRQEERGPVFCSGSLDACLFASVAGLQHCKRHLRQK